MSTIKVSVTDQVLKITSAPIIASGGVNETTVEFTFCEKWDGFAKTALFYCDETKPYYAVLDDNDICVVPWEVYTEPSTFYFTVFGNKDGVRRTANTVKYKVNKGLFGENAIPSDPTPSVYDQLVDLVAENKETLVQAEAIANDLAEKRDSGYFKGDKGEKGDPPVKGVDYWTEEDKAEIKSYVDEAILGGEW